MAATAGFGNPAPHSPDFGSVAQRLTGVKGFVDLDTDASLCSIPSADGIQRLTHSPFFSPFGVYRFVDKPSCRFPRHRPIVPCHHIREYRYAYGAVEPLTGESFFLVMPYCNTACMNVFLKKLSNAYPDDQMILACDAASWHRANALEIPHNIRLFFIPPATPEMNPIEQIWKEIRKRGFRNEIFKSLKKIVERLCSTICSLSPDVILSITGRKWILDCF